MPDFSTTAPDAPSPSPKNQVSSITFQSPRPPPGTHHMRKPPPMPLARQSHPLLTRTLIILLPPQLILNPRPRQHDLQSLVLRGEIVASHDREGPAGIDATRFTDAGGGGTLPPCGVGDGGFGEIEIKSGEGGAGWGG